MVRSWEEGEGDGVFGVFLSKNDKAGFEEGDAEPIVGKPGGDGDSVGTMRVIWLEVDAKVVNEKDGFAGVGNAGKDFINSDDK